MSPAARTTEIGTVEEGPLSAVLAALARDDPGGVVAALDGNCTTDSREARRP